jgi:hypothetical protein
VRTAGSVARHVITEGWKMEMANGFGTVRDDETR